MKKKKSRYWNWRKRLIQDSMANSRVVLAVYLILRGLVILSMIFQLLNENYENVFLCLLTLVLLLLPSILERKLRIDLPDTLQVILLLFVFAAEILGEIQEYYLIIPFWDDILHTINGFMFAAVGFSLVNILSENKKIGMTLSPAYMAISAFCFSMTIGILWEFFEWGMDSFFGLDMQKDTIISVIGSVNLDPTGHNTPHYIKGITDTIAVLSDGTQVSLGLGGYLDIGLIDTMMDLLVNLIGAVVFCTMGYFFVKSKGKSKIAKQFIPVAIEEEKEE